MDIEKIISALPQIKFRTGVNYFQLTTLGVGGTAPLVADVEDDFQLAELLKYAFLNSLKIFTIGAGSNLVGTDEPFPGIILRLRGEFMRSSLDDSGRLIAGGGAKLPEVVRTAAERGFGGLSKLAGIPGSIGGSLRMNAGANNCNISDKLVRLRGFRTDGTPWHSEKSQVEWLYRDSGIPADVIVTAAEFQLPRSNSEQESAIMNAELISRRSREPVGRTAGCVFRNPGQSDPAGKLIDLAGLKGREFGAVNVSMEHGNYLVNRGGASEKDFLQAASFIRRTIADKYGLYLDLEVKFIMPEHTESFYASARPPQIALFMGGDSSEREVSLRSGSAVAAALRSGGYPVRVFDLTQCVIPPETADYDLIFPVLHGSWGEDGRLQKLMEEANLEFIGSGSAASDLIMDKIKTKLKLRALDMPTAPEWIITQAEAETPPESMPFPVVVKVPREGSTVGIEKIDDMVQWRLKVPELLKQADELLAESFITGRECTVPVVLGQAMSVVEIRPPGGFYDYDAKYIYANGHTQYFCPPVRISPDEQKMLQDYAVRFYNEFDCRDLVRVDFIIGDADGVPYILEGNSLPGFTATSLVPKAAACMNISFERLCASLVSAHFRKEPNCEKE